MWLPEVSCPMRWLCSLFRGDLPLTALLIILSEALCPMCKPTSTCPCFPQSSGTWAHCELGSGDSCAKVKWRNHVRGSTVPHSTPLSFISPTVHFSFKKGDTICSWPKGPTMHHRFPLTRWSSDASLSPGCKACGIDQWKPGLTDKHPLSL